MMILNKVCEIGVHCLLESGSWFVPECFSVGKNEGRLETGQNPDFVQTVFLFLLSHAEHFDLLHCVELFVCQSLHSVDFGVGSVTCLG